ncbi:MAG: hypothetical protein R3A49_00295 [Acidimicrobiia bacterium]
MTAAPVRVGTLGGDAQVEVDTVGGVTFRGPPYRLDWWIGADDRWREPAREVAVRQHLDGGSPVVVTSVRVPSGDAVQTVYATGASVVMEIHNDSPAPFVAALLFSPGVSGTPVSAVLDDTRLLFDGEVVARFTNAPSAVTEAPDRDAVRVIVVDGVPPGTLPVSGASPEVVALFPVAHRARTRVAFPLGRGAEPAAPTALDDSTAVARGWAKQRERGLKVEWPDPSWDPVVNAARCDLLLRGSLPRPTPEEVAALEDWGHDDEAVAGWARLGFRGRARARRRPWSEAGAGALVSEVERRRREVSPVVTWEDGPAAFLLALRALLGRERSGGDVELLSALPSSFLGGDLTVTGLPTRRGPVSYALRWHGARPALLWEAPEGIRLRVPGIDPAWHTTAASGEVLLAAPTAVGGASGEAESDDLAGSDGHG